ncbi:hypothetical protein [Salinirubrum litoreum]|uniref:Uncharacterized protein n=1 Tax=Salinirubrum litoreum TaxID=1126234 RepID=A0ABD5R5M8_9EURY|nr:hypothetical protein [Salinirubrum litoreum]
MPSTRPSIRTVALVVLLVVGLGCSFTFHAVASGDVAYTATAVEPGEDPKRVADVAPDVADLNERLAGTEPEHRRPVREAERTGSYAGTVSPDLSIVLDDLESTRFVVSDSQYYAWNLTTDDETTSVEIEMRPVDATTVYTEVARPVETASTDVQQAVETGNATATGVGIERGLYEEDGTYYVVAPENEAAIAGRLLGTFVGFALIPVGRGYLAVALGLLALRYRESTVDRPLSPRRAVGVALLALPVALVGTALFESGSLSRFVTGPASALVVAGGVLAGVLAFRRQWLRLAGLTVGLGVLVVGAITVVLGLVGLFLGPLVVLLGLVAGVVPFGFGYWFGRREPATDSGTEPDVL